MHFSIKWLFTIRRRRNCWWRRSTTRHALHLRSTSTCKRYSHRSSSTTQMAWKIARCGIRAIPANTFANSTNSLPCEKWWYHVPLLQSTASSWAKQKCRRSLQSTWTIWRRLCVQTSKERNGHITRAALRPKWDVMQGTSSRNRGFLLNTYIVK